MKIYDEFGNIINILPTYQQGGFILPQYKPSQVTLQAPSSEGLFRATESGTNNDWNRFVQGTQLNLQASRASQDLFTNAIDIKLKMQTQERVNKQLELQNKKFEYEIMKNNLDIVNEALAMGSEEFIEGDQAKIDALYKPINDKLLSVDLRTVDGAMNASREKHVMKSTFINAYANADTFKKGSALLKDNPNDKLLEFASKNKILNFDLYEQYANSKQEWAKALNEFNKTGDRSILDKAQEHRNNIETTQQFIDSKAFKEQIDNAKLDQESERIENIANSEYKKQQALALKETTPYKIAELISDTKLQIANGRLKGAEADLKIRAVTEFENSINKWEKENPNANYDESSTFWNEQYNRYFGKTNGQGGYTSAEQMYAEGARTDDQELMDKALAWKTADNNKQTTVNYVTSNDGSTGEQNKDGSVNWGGHTIDKDGVTVTSVTVGNEPYTINTTGDDKGKVVGIPDAYLTKIGNKGYLKIKGDDGDNLEWVFGKYPGYGSWYTNDSLKDFSTSSAAPPGTKYEGGYLYIPQDDIKVTSTSSGSSYMGGGTTTISPNNPFNQ